MHSDRPCQLYSIARDRNCMIMLPNATKPSAVSLIDNHHVLNVSAKANTLFLDALCKSEGKKRGGLQLVKLRYTFSAEQSDEADQFCKAVMAGVYKGKSAFVCVHMHIRRGLFADKVVSHA